MEEAGQRRVRRPPWLRWRSGKCDFGVMHSFACLGARICSAAITVVTIKLTADITNIASLEALTGLIAAAHIVAIIAVYTAALTVVTPLAAGCEAAAVSTMMLTAVAHKT